MKNKHLIAELIHYLDDFFTADEADNIEVTKKVFHQLGVPLAKEKLEGPTTEITYIGIGIHSVRQEICLPAEKCNELSCLLDGWGREEKMHTVVTETTQNNSALFAGHFDIFIFVCSSTKKSN